MKKSEENLCETWDAIKRNIVDSIRVPEEEEWRMESILKGIMAKNFPNMGRYLDIQIIKLIGYPNISTQNDLSSLRHIIKHSEIKEFKKNPEEKQRSSH